MPINVTIIMPVYNAEKFLRENLDSIVNQTMREFELIAVNDGSSDHSLEILKEYAAKYPMIKVIDQPNGGPSSARNVALGAAQGEYVYFCDADDLLESDTIESLYYTAKAMDADMVIANYDIFNRHSVTPVRNLDSLISQTYIPAYHPVILWTFSLWNKLFRRSVIESNHFRFPPTSYSEDGVFTMNFTYHAHFITGLDKVVYHYRKTEDTIHSSITSSISFNKVQDYITSHNLIYQYASEYFLKNYPEYHSIEEAIANNSGISNYINEFWRKEAQILIGQFYKKYWSLEQNTISLIIREVNDLLGKMDLYNYSRLRVSHCELPLCHLYEYPDELNEHFLITLALFGNADDANDFIDVLRSYGYQTFVPLKIVVPSHMKPIIESQKIDHKNIFYMDGASTEDFFSDVLSMVGTPYIMFGHSKMLYNNVGIANMYYTIVMEHCDFVSSLIYTVIDGTPSPVALHSRAFRYLDRFRMLEKDGYFDCLCANKLFCTEFLRRLDINFHDGMSTVLEKVFRTAYFEMISECASIYNGAEFSFPKDMLSHCEYPEVKNYITEQSVTLFSTELQADPDVVRTKLLGGSTPSNRQDRFARLAMRIFQKLPVMNKVFFMNVRRNDGLEGNAKALEPYIRGRKVICSKMLPHDRWYKLKMYYHTLTSKVIICDDYNRYLRIFPLKSKQRVVQLWHACGAFKKFGQYGTTLSRKVDLATHAQYNLVCVSASNIRSIYADAFDISISKVKSLGCPRTDVFFDKDYIHKKCEEIYGKYPNFRDKEIIIYAPTFRDNVKGKDRSYFTPPLDFHKLSEKLLPNQVFLICPHPIMTHKILAESYCNIFEIRDFSTNDLMFISDMMITDYSSVIFEYALLGKPIIFFCYDLDQYERGFYLNYPDDLPGSVLYTSDELIDHLTKDGRYKMEEKFSVFVQNYMSGCDGHSAQRIAALINDYMEG